MGAGRVIAIDEVSERLAMAEAGGAETIDFSEIDVYDELMALTDNRGPDSCIDAVGCEASGHGATDATIDKVKAAAFLATDRVRVLRQAIMCCRKSWYGLDSGRVRWSGRQDTALRGDEQRAYIQERTDPCSGLY